MASGSRPQQRGEAYDTDGPRDRGKDDQKRECDPGPRVDHPSELDEHQARLRRTLAVRRPRTDSQRGCHSSTSDRSVPPAHPRYAVSAAGVRRVPISCQLASILEDYDNYLVERFGRLPEAGERYFPGDPVEVTFCPMALTERVQKAWKQADLEPIRLHGARHSYASLLIAAGVNPKEIQTYMGHASIQVTFNTYGHLFPGNESKTAVLIDAYIAQERGPVGGPTRAAAV